MVKKILKKFFGKSYAIFSKGVEKTQPQHEHRKELEAKVDAGLRKAIREYGETFRILADYDRS